MRNILWLSVILLLLFCLWLPAAHGAASSDSAAEPSVTSYGDAETAPSYAATQTAIPSSRPAAVEKINSPPVNPHATDEAVSVKEYLNECYGTVVLSGQFADGADAPEVKAVYKQTGKYPAILGFDFLYYGKTAEANKQVRDDSVNLAIDWWQRGGIVTFCWHWIAPKDNQFSEGLPWNKGFYAETTRFSIQKALSGEDPEGYGLLLADMDTIAAQLKILQQAGVPVLWRPLHEAAGGWFWWGAEGPEVYKALWRLMYDRMVNTHGLNNLLWVWNGQYSQADAVDAWYPGDDVVDIIGEDIYPNKHDHSSQAAAFAVAQTYTDDNKIIALTEAGVIPDIDLMIEDGSMWAWFCGWYREYMVSMNAGYQHGTYSEEYTEAEVLTRTYHHERVITLDELPAFGDLSASFWVQMGFVGWSGLLRFVLSALVLVVSATLIFFIVRNHRLGPQATPGHRAYPAALAKQPKAVRPIFVRIRFTWFQKIRIRSQSPNGRKIMCWFSRRLVAYRNKRNPPGR